MTSKKTYGAGTLCIRLNPYSHQLEVLIVKKKKDPSCYGIPGGKKEPDEDSKYLAITAIRETYEETGLVVRTYTSKMDRYELSKPPWTYGFYLFEDIDSNNFIFRTFRATVITGTLKESDEGIPYWGCPLDLLQGPFKDYNAKMLEHFNLIGPNSKINMLDRYLLLSKFKE